MKLIFATGNQGKVSSLQRYMQHAHVQIEARDLDLIEPQFDDIEDIARAKAEYAYRKLGLPVLVQDTGFYIEALNGFPGPYARYVNETIGAQGILDLMIGEENRKCGFVGVLAFADAQGQITTFRDENATGVIAQEMDQTALRQDAWSVLWHIFIPEGTTDVLNCLDDETRNWWYTIHREKNNFSTFADWFVQNQLAETNHKQKRILG